MDISIDEKRVYDASEGPTPVYVVGEFGVARVNTSDDLVGEFGLARECTARDAAGSDGRVAVATDEDVLVGAAGDRETDDEAGTAEAAGAAGTEFEALGVGPAVAVGYAGGELVAAREDGTVLRSDGTVRRGEVGDWTELGDLADVRAIDGDFVAAGSGVYRVTDDGLRHVGLDDARDVAAGAAPLAATASGLYRLGNGWLDELDGEFRAVSAPLSAGVTRATAGRAPWAHAAHTDGRLFERAGSEAENGQDDTGAAWREVDLPTGGEVVALDHGEARASTDAEDGAADAMVGAYAVTADGTFLLSVGDGWNHQILGLRGVRAVAAP